MRANVIEAHWLHRKKWENRVCENAKTAQVMRLHKNRFVRQLWGTNGPNLKAIEVSKGKIGFNVPKIRENKAKHLIAQYKTISPTFKRTENR